MALAAPFPYFGGKRRAAPRIWEALGDPSGYVEPFAGSAAVLLARPPFTGRRVETLNDADGWLVNTWRAIQLSPAEVARHAWGPVAEIDYHARLAWLQQRRTPDLVAWLEGDPEAHDAKAAGWWLYVLACGIGDPFGPGPWRVVGGHLRKLPHLGNAGQGVNRELPHLGDAGQGVNRELPHLGDAGQGQLEAYMGQLADRLRRVRITCGSWERVVKPSVTRSGTDGDGTRAIFLDPPYATSGDLYAESSEGVALAVREWCATAPRDLRVILCGYDSEHDALLTRGWSVTAGKAGRGAGYSVNPTNGRRERLWLSPACIGSEQRSLLEALA
jgi:site-specific DNA-adenine methylase